MRIWHVYVGSGRFLVRARTENEAIVLAIEEAKDYYPKYSPPTIDDAGIQTDLTLVGYPEVLDTDFS